MKQRLIIFRVLFLEPFFWRFFLSFNYSELCVARARNTVRIMKLMKVVRFLRFRQGNLSQCICRDGIRWHSIWLGWVRWRSSQRWSLCVAKVGSTLRAREFLRCRKWILVFSIGWRRWRKWLSTAVIVRKLSQCKSSITYDTATDIITRALRNVTAYGATSHEHHTTAITANELVSRRKHERTDYDFSRTCTHKSSPLQSDTSAPCTITQFAKRHVGR